ncbi:hypothetical protein HHI36_003106 [Cryptolaemus montrouzieri]|uniref:Uncharacterized protein n=1 Tax=Cryptolaemus montrouzieri TaxID=559131 RepID=A0ABD2PCH8_9CUCU
MVVIVSSCMAWKWMNNKRANSEVQDKQSPEARPRTTRPASSPSQQMEQSFVLEPLYSEAGKDIEFQYSTIKDLQHRSTMQHGQWNTQSGISKSAETMVHHLTLLYHDPHLKLRATETNVPQAVQQRRQEVAGTSAFNDQQLEMPGNMRKDCFECKKIDQDITAKNEKNLFVLNTPKVGAVSVQRITSTNICKKHIY